MGLTNVPRENIDKGIEGGWDAFWDAISDVSKDNVRRGARQHNQRSWGIRPVFSPVCRSSFNRPLTSLYFLTLYRKQSLPSTATV